MLKVTVETQVVDVKSGTSAKTGRPYSIREQEAWALFYSKDGKINPHPTKIKITLDDGQQPYQLGHYVLDLASLYPDKFGQISIRARLLPALTNAAKAA